MKYNAKTIKLVESAVRKIRNGISEGMPVHEKDDLLQGITFEDLIITVQSNEQVVNEKSVTKVFNELLARHIEDAREELRDNMKFIIKNASSFE